MVPASSCGSKKNGLAYYGVVSVGVGVGGGGAVLKGVPVPCSQGEE